MHLIRGTASTVAVLVAGLSGCGTADADPAVTEVTVPQDTWDALGARIRALPTNADARSLQAGLPAGTTLEVEGQDFTLALSPPLDARALAVAWRLERPFAVSGDVHQRTWTLKLFESELADASVRRIATSAPKLGPWTARIELDGRPLGAMPALVSGASPAYDLSVYSAAVSRIRFDQAH